MIEYTIEYDGSHSPLDAVFIFDPPFLLYAFFIFVVINPKPGSIHFIVGSVYVAGQWDMNSSIYCRTDFIRTWDEF